MELEKQQEEQQQKLDGIKHRNDQLRQEVEAAIKRIEEKNRQIEGINQDIINTKDRKDQEEQKKVNLEDETHKLRAQKLQETQKIKELEQVIQKTKEDKEIIMKDLRN